MMKKHKQTVFLLLIMLGLIFGCVFVCGMQLVLCQTPVMNEFFVPSSISTFLGTSDYTLDDVVMISRGQIQEQLNFLDEADSEFVSAFYSCQNGECLPVEVHVRVFVQRRMGCYLGGASFSSDDPFASTVTNFSFDIANDQLSATTLSRDDRRRNLLLWEELPLSIDEIIQIAFETEGDAIAREHPDFELQVTLLGDRWSLTFTPGATTAPETRLHMDFNGKLMAE